jgi:hypothetical protein
VQQAMMVELMKFHEHLVALTDNCWQLIVNRFLGIKILATVGIKKHFG